MSSSPLIPSSPAASEAGAAKTGNGNFPAPTRAHLILIVVGLTMFFVGHLTKGEVTMISIVKASTTESMYKQKAAINKTLSGGTYTKEELMSLIREMQANATSTTAAKEEEVKVEETTPSPPKAVSENNNNNCQSKLDELDQIWNARRENRRQATNDDAAYYQEKAFGMTVRAFDYFEPEAVCMDDERFGGLDEDPIRYQAFGDGPKFLCGVDILAEQAKEWNNNDNVKKPCLIYNVGSNNQIEFERAAHMEFGDGCEIHTFDPTLTSAQYLGHNYSQFHDWAFGQDGKKWKLHHARGTFKINEMSVHGVMRALRHLGRPIDILKIDCEGCEHAALLDAFKHIAEGKLQIHQIQVEFHLLRFGSKKKSEVAQDYNQFKRIWAAADRANMRVFHKERNGWGCNGYQCVEYAFVSSEYLRRVNSHYVC